MFVICDILRQILSLMGGTFGDALRRNEGVCACRRRRDRRRHRQRSRRMPAARRAPYPRYLGTLARETSHDFHIPILLIGNHFLGEGKRIPPKRSQDDRRPNDQPAPFPRTETRHVPQQHGRLKPERLATPQNLRNGKHTFKASIFLAALHFAQKATDVDHSAIFKVGLHGHLARSVERKWLGIHENSKEIFFRAKVIAFTERPPRSSLGQCFARASAVPFDANSLHLTRRPRLLRL